MPIRSGPVHEAARRARRQLDAVVDDLVAARHTAGLSQATVARAIGMSRQQLGAWERRRSEPSVSQMVLALADMRHNRSALAVGQPTLASAFPCPGREALGTLRRGQVPSANAIVLV